MRFLLGIAEAGFFPGVMYDLTTWLPDSARGRASALFLRRGSGRGGAEAAAPVPARTVSG